MKKRFFRCNSPCVTHVLLEKQICKSSKWGRPRDPFAGRPGDQMMGRSGDFHWTSVIHAFLNPTQKHIKLNLAGYSRLYSQLY